MTQAILASAAVLGVATGLSYCSMAPRSQIFGNTFTGAGPASRQIALTYDDGPSQDNTPKLLKVLERHQVKATFFMMGQHVAACPQVAAAVARAGHVIGNHTFSHPNLLLCSPARVRRELAACDQALTDAVGEHSRLFRPPFGGAVRMSCAWRARRAMCR